MTVGTTWARSALAWPSGRIVTVAPDDNITTSSLHDLIAAFGDGDWIKQYRHTRYSHVSLSPR
jgi:hypothetical protein